jgi:cell division protein FtsI/penicillin-binding protein 2
VFAMLAERIGPDQLLEYAKRFKFEKNIDLAIPSPK